MEKILALTERAEKLLERAKELGLTKEQKHIDSEDSPEKEYWHYGYAVALLDVYRNFLLTEIKGGQIETEVSDANGGQVPQTIKLQLKDFVEFLSMVDMALQPDFPINKSANLLNKIKQICLKYGINWTGRQT